MKSLLAVLIVVFINLSFIKPASSQPSSKVVAWWDYNYTYSFNTTWGLGGDAGIRGVVTDENWTRIYIRPILIYRNTDDLNFGLSFGAMQNFNEIDPNLFEFRPAQQVNLTWPEFKNWSVHNRFRIEERYFTYATSETQSVPAPFWAFRARYQLKIKTVKFDLAFLKRLHFLMSAEFFFPVEPSEMELYSNRSRLLVGYGQNLSDRLSYELHLFLQSSRSEPGSSFHSDQLIIRLRVYFRNEHFEFVEED